MKIVNLTPHKIYEVNTKSYYESSGIIARVDTNWDKAGYIEIDDIKYEDENGEMKVGNVEAPAKKATYGEVSGLPDRSDDTLYIVSGMVFEATNRTDLIAPGNLVRDESGKPIGCDGFKIK